MTNEAYLEALRRLKLPPTGKATIAALGLSVRQLVRLANDQAPIPRPVALLLAALLQLRRRPPP